MDALLSLVCLQTGSTYCPICNGMDCVESLHWTKALHLIWFYKNLITHIFCDLKAPAMWQMWWLKLVRSSSFLQLSCNMLWGSNISPYLLSNMLLYFQLVPHLKVHNPLKDWVIQSQDGAQHDLPLLDITITSLYKILLPHPWASLHANHICSMNRHFQR